MRTWVHAARRVIDDRRPIACVGVLALAGAVATHVVTPTPSFAQERSDSVPFCCVSPKPWVTAAQVASLQLLPWSWNYWVRDAEFARVSPESWVRNMEMGFEWDPNKFGTNMFAHPVHGSMYYNAGRTNGFNFWESAGITFAGSFTWEMYGETHRPAINDWMATTIGGISVGESLFRVATLIQNNEKTGFQRVLREVGSFIINPVSGFNRLVRGESWRVGPNPAHRKPSSFTTDLDVGARIVGPGNLGTETVRTGYLQADVSYGSAMAEPTAPFDYFKLAVQVNFADKPTLGRLQIKGNLWGRQLKESGSSRHLFALSLDHDYAANETFEVGAQSIGATVYSLFPMSERVLVATSVRLNGILLGAVNSEFAQVAMRDYDFGSGFSFRAGAGLDINGRTWITAFYDGSWIHALNGSNADHLIHAGGVELMVPVWRSVSLGTEFYIFARNSYYDEFGPVHRRNPTFRFYTSIRGSAF